MLTEREVTVLESVKNGADVYSYTVAKILRECQKRGLVEIVEPMTVSNSCSCGGECCQERRPYFGAILTAEGLMELKGGN